MTLTASCFTSVITFLLLHILVLCFHLLLWPRAVCLLIDGSLLSLESWGLGTGECGRSCSSDLGSWMGRWGPARVGVSFKVMWSFSSGTRARIATYSSSVHYSVRPALGLLRLFTKGFLVCFDKEKRLVAGSAVRIPPPSFG